MAYTTDIDTSTLSNQNISSALLVHTFTNTTRKRKIVIDVFATQLAGNGDYVVYATRQRAGSGAAYEVGARTTVAVPSGVTSQMFPTIALMCGATDVIKVYLVGLAGDTTTPDIITDVSEEYVLTDSSGNVTFANTSIATVTTLTNAPSDSSGITTLLTRVVGTLLTGNHNPQSGDAYARLGAPAGASVSADIDALPTANENADALLDRAAGVETGVTPRQSFRLMLAALAGKLSGAATTTVTIRNVGDSKDRITATVDADGNRSAVTTDAT